MKLLKYFLFILVLIGGLVFFVELTTMNKFENIIYKKDIENGSIVFNTEGEKERKIDAESDIKIQIPYLADKNGKLGFNKDGLEVWKIILGTLSVGVSIGFLMALFQIISQKSSMIKQRSKLRRLQIELDDLRNQAIEDDIDIIDELDGIDELDESEELSIE